MEVTSSIETGFTGRKRVALGYWQGMDLSRHSDKFSKETIEKLFLPSYVSTMTFPAVDMMRYMRNSFKTYLSMLHDHVILNTVPFVLATEETNAGKG